MKTHDMDSKENFLSPQVNDKFKKALALFEQVQVIRPEKDLSRNIDEIKHKQSFLFSLIRNPDFLSELGAYYFKKEICPHLEELPVEREHLLTGFDLNIKVALDSCIKTTIGSPACKAWKLHAYLKKKKHLFAPIPLRECERIVKTYLEIVDGVWIEHYLQMLSMRRRSLGADFSQANSREKEDTPLTGSVFAQKSLLSANPHQRLNIFRKDSNDPLESYLHHIYEISLRLMICEMEYYKKCLIRQEEYNAIKKFYSSKVGKNRKKAIEKAIENAITKKKREGWCIDYLESLTLFSLFEEGDKEIKKFNGNYFFDSSLLKRALEKEYALDMLCDPQRIVFFLMTMKPQESIHEAINLVFGDNNHSTLWHIRMHGLAFEDFLLKSPSKEEKLLFLAYELRNHFPEHSLAEIKNLSEVLHFQLETNGDRFIKLLKTCPEAVVIHMLNVFDLNEKPSLIFKDMPMSMSIPGDLLHPNFIKRHEKELMELRFGEKRIKNREEFIAFVERFFKFDFENYIKNETDKFYESRDILYDAPEPPKKKPEKLTSPRP